MPHRDHILLARAQLARIAEPSSGLSRAVAEVVVGDPSSTKALRAQELRIATMTAEDFAALHRAALLTPGE